MRVSKRDAAWEVRTVEPARIVGALLRIACLVGLGGIALITSGCGAKAGMACQQQSDCRAGLICSKPPGAAPNAYGSCEPARRGLGESCLRSTECEIGLACSSARGNPGGDGWYGVCEPAPLDLLPPPDMAMPDLVMFDL
jgi:hypothetical protein